MVRYKAQPIYLEFSDNEHESSIHNFKNLYIILVCNKLKLAIYIHTYKFHFKILDI